jgi:hypothetical protein
MFDWERRVLGSAPVDHVLSVRARVETRATTGTAWLVTGFFAPDVWTRWQVGLVHGSLNLYTAEPLDLPSPFRLQLPETVRALLLQWKMESLADRWREVDVCPALVDRKALAFVIRQSVPDNPKFFEMFAPTHLTSRLGLRDGSEVQLDLRSGSRSNLA